MHDGADETQREGTTIMMMKTNVTIELSFDSDTVTAVDVINRIKELIETDSLYFRWEKDEDRHE